MDTRRRLGKRSAARRTAYRAYKPHRNRHFYSRFSRFELQSQRVITSSRIAPE